MPVVVSCSACGRRLKLRNAAQSGRVRCPACGVVFVVRPEGVPAGEEAPRCDDSPESGDDTYAVQAEPTPAPPPAGRRDAGPARRRRRPLSEPDDDEDGPDLQAHRGPLILALGVLSVVLSCIPLAGWALGAMSMTMGSRDERLMEARVMERAGHGMTRAGQICGIFGVFFATVVFILALFIRMSRYARHW